MLKLIFLLVSKLTRCLRHLHCLLVWFKQLAGELAEDGQVGEVRRRSRVWSLTEFLEHKLYAVPKRIKRRTSGTKDLPNTNQST